MINLGVGTYKELDSMRADLYIMGIYNIDVEAGTSVPTKQEAEIKSKMISVSTEVLSMITNDKFGTISKQIVGPIDDISFLISENVPDKIKKEYGKSKLILID
ncbi:hypothetical protein GCM10025853_18290 [Tetragenococcus halophilus subsp. halophilus DSM 20339]|nr:hypothetical protein GCM10025853_18290 [Tetragenococcus halophilus subsp. halophilus DSM 20339]